MHHDKPLDARLAAWLVYPLRNTAVTPNHLTTVRLFTGVVACVLLATGDPQRVNAGAWCFALSNFLDHSDGELARLTGKTSKSGHYYDLISDAIINILLFVSIGFGLLHGSLGAEALFIGILAGVAVAATFHLRMMIGSATGRFKVEQPGIGLFEIEDIFYLLPLVTLFDMLQPFLIIAAIGAPVFALWTLREYQRCKRGRN